jgi:hypothetical protein
MRHSFLAGRARFAVVAFSQLSPADRMSNFGGGRQGRELRADCREDVASLRVGAEQVLCMAASTR